MGAGAATGAVIGGVVGGPPGALTGASVGSLVDGGAGGSKNNQLAVRSGVFQWLDDFCTPVYNSIMRWWGGEAQWERIWADYKRARNEIIRQEKNNSTRQILLQDLRQEFRNNNPVWAGRFN